MQKRVAAAEEETEKAHKQIDKLKRKYEKEVSTMSQMIEQYRLPKHASQDAYLNSNMAEYCPGDIHRVDDRWKEEFEWFSSGYDGCNI
ncbi:hypothetical protein Nepgr_020467 [Nepenthes gracilis]|uniref:Uncharacterized protein n=1 Tax=Nepenthes gracilis TaxID=150966 RepID=A0AAD3SXC7_NEPGR|nr:hypothetical protein Nepgr_020467 [Nepenthes gracilis]